MRIILDFEGKEGEDKSEDIEKLYEILSVLHSKFDVLHDRFKDYVSSPKPNGYKSLHTAIIGLNSSDPSSRPSTWSW